MRLNFIITAIHGLSNIVTQRLLLRTWPESTIQKDRMFSLDTPALQVRTSCFLNLNFDPKLEIHAAITSLVFGGFQ